MTSKDRKTAMKVAEQIIMYEELQASGDHRSLSVPIQVHIDALKHHLNTTGYAPRDEYGFPE